MATGHVPVIDISSNQGNLDAAVAKAAGVQGVYCRAAHGMSRDPRFADYVARCAAVGLPVGAYMFFEPAAASATRAVPLMLSLCAGKPLTLPPMADLERSMTPSWLADYFARTEPPLRRHVIYLNDSLGFDGTAFRDRDVICPDYVNAAEVAALDPAPPSWFAYASARKPAGPGIPRGWSTWSMWQWSADGNGQSARYGCTGGNTAVDLNIVKADAWSRWAPLSEPTPVEVAAAVWG